MAAASFGNWRVQAVLGRGRMSTVYLARGAQGRRAALKVSRGAGQRYETEFGIALGLPGAVQPYERGAAAGGSWLAMEYAEGGTLAQRALPLPRDEALHFARQAAQALAQLHAAGWVHRDVKPANLLLRADGSLALGDFGSACRRGAQESLPAGTIVGTPRYAAPEQWQGAPAMPSADVYSLGAVLFEMLCGRPPYAGETPTELLAQHLLAPLPQLAPAHADLQPLVHAMLAKNPRDRLPDVQSVLAGLGNRT